jgi:tetratricopeptide (TPR) repeat protein
MLNNAWEIAQVVNSRALAASALFHLGIVYDYKGGHEAALAYLDIALIMWRELNNRRQQGFTLNSLGVVAYRLPRDYRSLGQKALAEALAISQANGDLQGQSMALNNLSLLATADQDFEAAQTYLWQSLQIVQYNGDQHGQALVYHNLGANASHAGKWAEVERYAEQALQLRRLIGDKRGEARDLKMLGDVMRANGRFDQALTYYQTAYNFSQQVGDRHNEKVVHQTLQELFAESDGKWGQMANSSPLS